MKFDFVSIWHYLWFVANLTEKVLILQLYRMWHCGRDFRLMLYFTVENRSVIFKVV